MKTSYLKNQFIRIMWMWSE